VRVIASALPASFSERPDDPARFEIGKSSCRSDLDSGNLASSPRWSYLRCVVHKK
jgi:hypothetical protein